ncbi:MAG TPA: hypothetical protein VGD81_01420 [Opitutaceae bacterium]
MSFCLCPVRVFAVCWLGLTAGAWAVSPVIVRPPGGEADAVPVIRAALEQAAREGATEVRFEPGTYHLFRDKALEKFLHVSNHDDGLRRLAFPLVGVRDLRIDGGGARFVCHGHLIPFLIEDSRNVVIENLSLDWVAPFFLQARVTAVDAAADAFEIEPLPECRARLVDGQLLFGEGNPRNREGWWQNIEWAYWIDPATRAAARVQPRVALWNAKRGVAATAAPASAPGRFRLVHAATPLPEPGSVLISKGAREDNRVSPAFHLLRSDAVRLENIRVHHAGGMGLIAERCDGVTLRRFDVALPPDSARLVSTTADATHFILCRGEILVEDCLFENMLDDAINVHGVYGVVRDTSGPATAGIGLVHFQQLGLDFARPGDVLRFCPRDTLIPYGERTVRSVRRLNQNRLEIEFTEPLEGFLRPDSCVDNLTWQARLVFRRNHVRNNRARSVLVTTSAPALIEDNRFERPSMMSILVEGDADFWHESGPIGDLTIRRNTFIGHHPSAALLRLRPQQPGETRLLPPYHRNLAITDNTFRVVHPLVLEASRVGGLLFAGNRVELLEDAVLKPGPSVSLRACEEVVLRANVFALPAPASLEVVPADVPVALEGNSGLASPR